MYSNKYIRSVSYPIFLSLLAQNIINVTDTAFLGHVSETALGASAMGGLFYICAFTIAFGFSIGSQILIARRNGEKQYPEVGPIMTQGVIFLLALAFLLFALTRMFGGSIMKAIISSDATYDATMEFLNWRIFGFFFSFVNVMFRAFYIGITRTKVLTVNALVMASVNVALDYAMIFGKFGFPVMGIQGAAIASVIAEACSTVFLLVYTYAAVDFKRYGLARVRRFDTELLKRILGISNFTMLQHFLSMGTFFAFFIVVEKLGERELAIANIVRSIYIILFIPIGALCATANSLVSNMIGAGDSQQVPVLIKKISGISFLTMLVLAGFIAIFPETILSLYTGDSLLIADCIPAVYVICIAMLISSVSSVVFNSVSGTGNTRAALFLEIFTLVFYMLYMLLVGVLLRQPVEICFTTEIVYYSFLLAACLLYFKKAKWQDKKI